MKMDLQFFAEEGGGEGQAAPEPTSAPDTVDYEYQGGFEPEPNEGANPQNPLVEGYEPEGEGQPDGEEGGDSSESQVQEFDFGGRKVRMDDPESIKGAFDDFQEAQRTLQQLQQQNKTYEQMVQMMQQQGQQPGQPQADQNQNQQPQLSEEEIAQRNEKILEKFYDNPYEALQEMAQEQARNIFEQEYKPQLDPIRQEHKWQSELQNLAGQHEDFENYVPQMQEIVENNDRIRDLIDQDAIGLEEVYHMAKGQSAATQPSPEQMLNDPNFQQQIMQNENIRNQILNNHMQQKQKQVNDTPTVMGNQPGGGSPKLPPQSPKTLNEASRLFRKSLGYE